MDTEDTGDARAGRPTGLDALSSWLQVDMVELVGALVVAGLGLVLAVAVWSSGDVAVATDEPTVAVPTSASAPTEVDEVVVHVTGAVAAAGLVRLAEGARVADAIDGAGGPTAGADLTAVNLARQVVDGEQVHVPVPGEEVTDRAADGGVDGDGRVVLNRATAAELETLPGIGPVIAGRIVAHRDANGPFPDLASLVAVPGIGERTVGSLADLVVVP